MPKLVAAFAGVSVLLLWLGHSKSLAQTDLLSAVVAAALLVACSLAGVWQYRRNRRSLRAILRLFQMGAWPLSLSFLALALALVTAMGSAQVYAAHWPVILSVFVGVLLALTGSYVTYRRVYRDQYEAFASYRAAGTMSADALYAILSFQGRSTRAAARLPLIVGVAVPLFAIVGLTLNQVLHRDIREMLAVCIFFLLSNYFMAVLIARRWLQWRYLGAQDLIVVD